MKQLDLFKSPTISKTFGGTLLKGKRKTARPLESRKPLHLVLKATDSRILLRRAKIISMLIKYHARRTGVRIYQVAIHADHIHLALKIPGRVLYVRWIRAVTAGLARRVGVRWKLRPFTRIAGWGRDFASLRKYLEQNQLEANLITDAHARVGEFRQATGQLLRKFSASLGRSSLATG